MFANCVYPTSWSKGVIVSIDEKGDKKYTKYIILRNRMNK